MGKGNESQKETTKDYLEGWERIFGKRSGDLFGGSGKASTNSPSNFEKSLAETLRKKRDNKESTD